MAKNATLKQQISAQIFEDITNGKYQPNDIITESEMIARFNVSKSPVREALVELCKDDVLRSLPRLGYQVVNISLREVLDILDFRLDIEICNLDRAFSKISDADIETLREIATMNPEEERLVSPHWESNQKFHLKICELSQNEYSYKVLRETLKKSSLYISQYFNFAWERARESNGAHHMAIVQALEEKNLVEAKRMLTTDILAVKSELQALHF